MVTSGYKIDNLGYFVMLVTYKTVIILLCRGQPFVSNCKNIALQKVKALDLKFPTAICFSSTAGIIHA